MPATALRISSRDMGFISVLPHRGGGLLYIVEGNFCFPMIR